MFLNQVKTNPSLRLIRDEACWAFFDKCFNNVLNKFDNFTFRFDENLFDLLGPIKSFRREDFSERFHHTSLCERIG